MGAATHLDADPTPAPWLLWAGILAGPFAWGMDLGISYALVKGVCGGPREAMLYLISAGSFAIAAAGLGVSWIALRNAGGHARARFMAALGVLSGALFLIAIAGLAIPRWVLHGCD